MESKLLTTLKRAISALNTARNFRTSEGIMSYALIPQLEEVVKEFEKPRYDRLAEAAAAACLDYYPCLSDKHLVAEIIGQIKEKAESQMTGNDQGDYETIKHLFECVATRNQSSYDADFA